MARKLRIEFPGAIYHIMNRGDRREEIFRDDVDGLRISTRSDSDSESYRTGVPILSRTL